MLNPAGKKSIIDQHQNTTSHQQHQHMLCFGAGLCCFFQQRTQTVNVVNTLLAKLHASIVTVTCCYHTNFNDMVWFSQWTAVPHISASMAADSCTLSFIHVSFSGGPATVVLKTPTTSRSSQQSKNTLPALPTLTPPPSHNCLNSVKMVVKSFVVAVCGLL